MGRAVISLRPPRHQPRGDGDAPRPQLRHELRVLRCVGGGEASIVVASHTAAASIGHPSLAVTANYTREFHCNLPAERALYDSPVAVTRPVRLSQPPLSKL